VTKHRFLLAGVMLASALAASIAAAGSINPAAGDRPYFRGQTYWENDWEMTWVPGHWSRDHAWIHGHYIRGQQRPARKHDRVQEDRERHDNHQFDDAHRHHRPRG
jgi:Spy/CpxP family protein refolding chaperone